jgi:hypothetical protein
MRIRYVGLAALGLAVCLSSGVNAQDEGQKKDEKLTNVQGKVQSIDNKANTLVIAVDGSAPRQVVYNASTKFLHGHSTDGKPAAATQIKNGNFIACSGTFDNKAQLQARDCVFRETK